MYPASTAREIGLVDEVVDGTRLMARAGEIATTLAGRRLRAFSSTKLLLRKPIADEMARRERASIDEFVDIWYSEPTWSNLQNITIRS
jgi:enoyl-CoA hydratase/carnithine racemase